MRCLVNKKAPIYHNMRIDYHICNIVTKSHAPRAQLLAYETLHKLTFWIIKEFY